MSATVGDGSPLTANGVVNGTQLGSYTLPLLGTFRVESVVAQIDASAAPAVTPTVRVKDKSGAVIATKRQSSTIPAGDTGSATWALRLADEAPAATTAVTKVYDHTLTAPAIWHIGSAVQNVFRSGFAYVEAHLWAKVPTGTYVGVPPTVRMSIGDGLAVANRWRLIAAGSFTNISANGEEDSSAVGFAPQLGNTAPLQAAFSYTRVTWFNYQSNAGYKQWISDGMTPDQSYSNLVNLDRMNRWTGAGWHESTNYPINPGGNSLGVWPNANPSGSAGAPDAGRFATGTRLLVLGYTAI